MPENKHLRFLLIVAYIIIGYVFLTRVCPELVSLFLPFILAFILAAVTSPLVKMLRGKLKFPKWLATSTSLIVVWFAIIGAISLCVNKIIVELSSFISQLPTIISKVSITLKVLNVQWASFTQNISPELSTWLNELISKVTTLLISLVEPITTFTINSATNFATSIPSALIFTVAFILSCIFMTNDFDHIKHSLFMQIPEKGREKILLIKKYVWIALGKYLRGMGVILLITFVELFIGLSILRVSYAFSIALIIALVDILPVFGTGTILIPWALISLISGDYKFALGIAIIYAVITVVRQFIEPKVMSKSLGTYPLVTLVAMYIGLRMFGVLGMIFGPIVVLVLMYLQNSGIIHFWNSSEPKKEPPVEQPPKVTTDGQ